MSERILVADPELREDFIGTLRDRVPEGWQLVTEPEGTTCALTQNADVDLDELHRRGGNLRLVAVMEPGDAVVSGERASGDHVSVVRIPNTALTGVAELTVTAILALVKNLRAVHDATRVRQWLPDRSEPILTDQRKYTYNWIGIEDFGTLYRKKIGIVGLGHIGRAVVARMRPFGVQLLYSQRNRLSPDDERRLGVAYRTLDDLLTESDVVTLHHRFHEGEGGNDRQFGADAFAKMKPDAYFVNTARGRLVDEDALAAALRTDRIAGAALDVFRYEPLPDDHAFFDIPPDKLLLTPHIAGAPIDEAWRLASDTLIETLRETPARNA